MLEEEKPEDVRGQLLKQRWSEDEVVKQGLSWDEVVKWDEMVKWWRGDEVVKRALSGDELVKWDRVRMNCWWMGLKWGGSRMNGVEVAEYQNKLQHFSMTETLTCWKFNQNCDTHVIIINIIINIVNLWTNLLTKFLNFLESVLSNNLAPHGLLFDAAHSVVWINLVRCLVCCLVRCLIPLCLCAPPPPPITPLPSHLYKLNHLQLLTFFPSFCLFIISVQLLHVWRVPHGLVLEEP